MKLFGYNDKELVVGIQNGDKGMSNALFKHCWRYYKERSPMMFYVDEMTRDDIFQDTLVVLWMQIEQGVILVQDDALCFRNKAGKVLPMVSNLRTYFMGIAKNKHREYQRTERKMALLADHELPERAEDAETDDMMETQTTIINNCIARMPHRCQQILTMFYYEELALDDILLRLEGMGSKDALKTRKNKCMNTLKESARELVNRYGL